MPPTGGQRGRRDNGPTWPTVAPTAFDGQTPDEMFFGTGAHVPDALATARAYARQARLATNRALQCAVCA